MGKPHKVFISWSGTRSRYVAEALRTWLPIVIQAVGEPFMSEHMDKGARSMATIAKALEGTKVGVVCLTPENLEAPWILYEAGALSKTVNDETRLCTYLFGGLERHQVEQPLGMFQATRAEKEETRKLVHTINKAVNEEPLPESRVDELFDLAWPKLNEKLASVPKPEKVTDPERSLPDMVAEILDIVRTLPGWGGMVVPLSLLDTRARRANAATLLTGDPFPVVEQPPSPVAEPKKKNEG